MSSSIKVFITNVVVVAVGIGSALTAPQAISENEQEQVFADDALRMATHTSHPLEDLLALNIVISEMETLSPDGQCGDEPFIAEGDLQATVQFLTLFRMPVAQFTVGCTWASRS